MKTCKTGCGKMQAGGSVKKVKKMAKGGTAGIVGMPQYGNNPRTYSGRMAKIGGSVKKYQDGGPTIAESIKKDRREIFRTPSGKAGIITSIVGGVAEGIAMGLKKRREKKAAKEAEKKKKETATPKAKFGMSVGVKASCKNGMVRGADGKCVMSRPKFKSGGPLKPVPTDNVGLSKLPTAVRNKMGYMKKGGVKKR